MQGARETLGCKSHLTVVSPGMGDGSELSGQAQRQEQVWEGGLGTMEASVGPAGPLSSGCCDP